MTWIKTIPMAQADPGLQQCIENTMKLYPPEYAVPVDSVMEHEKQGEAAAIIMAHTLIPEALYHAFATYGRLLSPELPLTRRQHELITATVSSLNGCFY